MVGLECPYPEEIDSHFDLLCRAVVFLENNKQTTPFFVNQPPQVLLPGPTTAPSISKSIFHFVRKVLQYNRGISYITKSNQMNLS
jgi:hypothetical protein